MRPTRWFAAICASLGAVSAAAADGVDLSLRSRALPLKVEAVESSSHVVAPLVPPATLETALPLEPERPVVRPGCRVHELCYDGRHRDLFYRGARGYMPSLEGMAAEGISLRHDRLILRYSFR
jgi:hypothetical protein